jgi:cytochrome P450
MQSETNKISLHVMAGAGYGYPLEWDEAGEIPEGHGMSFHDSIQGTLDNIITYVIVPKYLLRLPIKHFRETKRAFDEVGKYVLDLLDMGKKGEVAKSEIGENILSNLIRHSIHIWDGPKDHTLNDDEIIGNAFVFLVGGHETTYIHSCISRLMLGRTHCCMLYICWQFIPKFRTNYIRRFKKPAVIDHPASAISRT